MLVLSRRKGETVVFPELDVVLEVLAVKGKATRLGVRAPANVKVLRGELKETCRKAKAVVQSASEGNSGKLMHRIRNWLHSGGLRMQLIRRYLEGDRIEEAAELIQKLIEDFRQIESGWSQADHSVPAVQETTPRPDGALASSSRRALLVEDNDCERVLMAKVLRDSGLQVETAEDGAAALEYLASHDQPDLLLLDMLMPRCDGPTVLRRIRSSRVLHDLKVFAVSGTSPANWDFSSEGGVDRWFTKPVDPDELLEEIHRELEPVAEP